jgi:hypothetical protein
VVEHLPSKHEALSSAKKIEMGFPYRFYNHQKEEKNILSLTLCSQLKVNGPIK